ncbi:MAG: hypothetical protein H6747_10050 [Deltaproteobacteria bacterium]|nr:hypothetical protein [Deltaproteobacteria bacterium]
MITAIVNPKAQTRHAELVHALTSASGRLRILAADEPSAIDALLSDPDQLAATELIIVAGGDGTVSNLLTRAGLYDALDRLPPMLLLPVGDVGTAARELVGAGAVDALASRVLVAWGRGVRRIAQLPVVRLRVGGESSRVGITASLGAIARAHRDYAAAVVPGSVGLSEVLLRFGTGSLPDDRFRRIAAEVRWQDPLGRSGAMQGVTAALLSPLPGFFGWVRPFPAVRGLAVDGVHGLVSGLGPFATKLSLPRLLRGVRPNGRRFHAGPLAKLQFEVEDDPDVAVVDGERVALPPGATVSVEALAPLRVVAWRPIPKGEIVPG